MTTCQIEYVYENACVSQPATITPDGNVQPYGPVEIQDADGDTYAWCATHSVRIHSGETHEGHTLANDWETV